MTRSRLQSWVAGLDFRVDEYLRPWKLLTLALGLGLLLLGAFYYQAPDWDVPVSMLMAAFTYLTASWSLHVLAERRWRYLPLMLFFTWWSVDGCYALYWSLVNPEALAWMRDVNWPASLCLYLLCGAIWYPRCSLRDIAGVLRRAS